MALAWGRAHQNVSGVSAMGIDEMAWAGEARQLREHGYEPVLKHSRWLLLKRPENLTAKEPPKLAQLLRYNLRAVRAYLLKEDFQFFWSYRSRYWAGQFLDRWCTCTLRTKIEPMQESRQNIRQASCGATQWVQGQRRTFFRSGEGYEHPSKTDPQKSLWL